MLTYEPRQSAPPSRFLWPAGPAGRMALDVSKVGIKQDLEGISRVGIGGLRPFHAALETPQGFAKRLAYRTPASKTAPDAPIDAPIQPLHPRLTAGAPAIASPGIAIRGANFH